MDESPLRKSAHIFLEFYDLIYCIHSFFDITCVCTDFTLDLLYFIVCIKILLVFFSLLNRKLQYKI